MTAANDELSAIQTHSADIQTDLDKVKTFTGSIDVSDRDFKMYLTINDLH